MAHCPPPPRPPTVRGADGPRARSDSARGTLQFETLHEVLETLGWSGEMEPAVESAPADNSDSPLGSLLN